MVLHTHRRIWELLILIIRQDALFQIILYQAIRIRLAALNYSLRVKDLTSSRCWLGNCTFARQIGTCFATFGLVSCGATECSFATAAIVAYSLERVMTGTGDLTAVAACLRCGRGETHSCQIVHHSATSTVCTASLENHIGSLVLTCAPSTICRRYQSLTKHLALILRSCCNTRLICLDPMWSTSRNTCSRVLLITCRSQALHRAHRVRLVPPNIHRIIRPTARIICIWRAWQATKVSTARHTGYQPIRLSVHLLSRLHPLLFLLEHHSWASLIVAMVWIVHTG